MITAAVKQYWGFAQTLYHCTPSWVQPGAVFHLRIRAAETQQPCLTEPELAKRLLDSALYYQENRKWNVTLFLLMPDHLHALLSFPAEPVKVWAAAQVLHLHALLSFPAEPGMSRTISDWKRFHTRRNGIQWQGNYFDHRLRNDEQLRLKWHYIRQNPVVKNLCNSPEDWPWQLGGS